jgi:hypothetical protein
VQLAGRYLNLLRFSRKSGVRHSHRRWLTGKDTGFGVPDSTVGKWVSFAMFSDVESLAYPECLREGMDVEKALVERLPTAESVFVDLHVDALASKLYALHA